MTSEIIPSVIKLQAVKFSHKVGWIGCAIHQANPKGLPGCLKIFQLLFILLDMKLLQCIVNFALQFFIFFWPGGVMDDNISTPSESISTHIVSS